MRSDGRWPLAVSWILTATFSLVSLAATPQDLSSELKSKVDRLVASSYQAAAATFPCKVKTRGKPRMLRWQEVDRCLNDAAQRVDWPALSAQLTSLRENSGVGEADFRAAVEASFTANALPLDKVFEVKRADALLPLTHSVLKFLPADALLDTAVFDKVGTRAGTFAGTYVYERTGGLASANTFKLTRFQYKDETGNVQSPQDKLLLDSYGVPWKDVATQRAFRIPADGLFTAK
jgi:hypothetical protein